MTDCKKSRLHFGIIAALTIIFCILPYSVKADPLDLWQYSSGGFGSQADTTIPLVTDTIVHYRGGTAYGAALKTYVENHNGGRAYSGAVYTPMYWVGADLESHAVTFYDTCTARGYRWWEGYHYCAVQDTQTFAWSTSSELRSDEFGIYWAATEARSLAVDMPGVIVNDDGGTEYEAFQNGGTNANLILTTGDTLVLHSPYPIDTLRCSTEIAMSADGDVAVEYYGKSGWTSLGATVDAAVEAALETASEWTVSLVNQYSIYDIAYIAPSTGTGNTHKQCAIRIRFTAEPTTWPKIDKLRRGYFYNQYTAAKCELLPWNPVADTNGNGWRDTGSGAMCRALAKIPASLSNRRLLGGYTFFACSDTMRAAWAISLVAYATNAGAINFDQSAFVAEGFADYSSTFDFINANHLDTIAALGATDVAKHDSANFQWKRDMLRWIEAVKDTGLSANSNFIIWITVSGPYGDTLPAGGKLTGTYGTYARQQLAAADSSNPWMKITDSAMNKRYKSIDYWLLEDSRGHSTATGEMYWSATFAGRWAGMQFVARFMQGGAKVVGMWEIGDPYDGTDSHTVCVAASEQVLNWSRARHMMYMQPFSDTTAMWVTYGRYSGVSGAPAPTCSGASGDSRDMCYGPDLDTTIDIGDPIWAVDKDSSYAFRHNGPNGGSDGDLGNSLWKDCKPSVAEWLGDSIPDAKFRLYLNGTDTNMVIVAQDEAAGGVPDLHWDYDSNSVATYYIGRTLSRIISRTSAGGAIDSVWVDTLAASDSITILKADGYVGAVVASATAPTRKFGQGLKKVSGLKVIK